MGFKLNILGIIIDNKFYDYLRAIRWSEEVIYPSFQSDQVAIIERFTFKLIGVLLITIMPFSVLFGGVLIVSGDGGYLDHKIEYSDKLSNDWVRTLLNHDSPITIFSDYNEADAWVTISYTNDFMDKSIFTEIYFNNADTVVVEFLKNYHISTDNIGIRYPRHPDLENQLCYDLFLSESPYSYVINFFNTREKDIISNLHDIDYLPNLIEAQFFNIFLDCNSGPINDNLSPYRIRMLYRFCGTTCGLISDESLFESIDFVDRKKIISSILNRFPPIGLGYFHGRYWSYYVSIGCLSFVLEDGYIDTLRKELNDVLVKECNFDLPRLSDNFICFFEYENQTWFEYFFAKELQGYLEIFVENPEMFNDHFKVFNCLFPSSPYTAKLSTYFE